MRFMCQKHKLHFFKEPEAADMAWKKLMYTARGNADNGYWQEAIKYYGNALDVAEMLFISDPVSIEVNRYVRTAVEFIYAIRKSPIHYDYSNDVSYVDATIQKALLPADIQLLIKPLIDTANEPLADVELWMNTLFLEDQYRP